jgi:drug/metabolite transporter (DMT)-like permease
LSSAAAWGAGDYGGGALSRRAPVFGVVLVSQLVGMVIAIGIAFLRAEPLPGPVDVAWSVAAGIAGPIGISALYRGLAIGRMGVVAPVTGLLAAILPVAAGVVLEGLPSRATLGGIGLAIVAVILVTRVAGESAGGRQGLGLAVVAGIGFGLFSICIAQVSPGFVFWPLVIVRAIAALLIGSIIVVSRSPWRLTGRILPAAMVVGVLDVAGNAFFVLARQAGDLAVAAALSSLYPVVTVLLAAVILGERVSRAHAVGIVTAGTAIVLIGLGSAT